MIGEVEKLEFIFSIDRWLKPVEGTIYEKELKALRRKYIYKDISTDDYNKDKQYLNNIKDMLYYYETQKLKRYERQI